jgi:hypothetical protein
MFALSCNNSEVFHHHERKRTMTPYPNFRDLERQSGIAWCELAGLEPELRELLWAAQQEGLTCRQWADVNPTFAPIRNRLGELVGFSGKNCRHPILGSPGAYQVVYWKLYDAVAGLLPRPARSADDPQQWRRDEAPLPIRDGMRRPPYPDLGGPDNQLPA